MGGASKLTMLLSTPSPLPRRPCAIRLAGQHPRLPLTSPSVAILGAQHRVLSSRSLPRHGFPLRAADERVHTQTSTREGRAEPFGSGSCYGVSSAPWPEWAKMVEHVSAGGYVGRRGSPARGEDDDAFSEELLEEFAKAAGGCLLFARERPDLLRLLPKRDIAVVVENGLPFLFRNAPNSVRRMKSFISSDGSNVLGSEQACTIDLMRYLLSYACNPLGTKGDDTESRELVEASVRSLLCELVMVGGAVQEPNATDSTAGRTSARYEQSQKPPVQKIGMKRGDWICPKCSFMNFARNMECLECKEVRPRRQLTGEEWECPQCDFFNHGRNMSCLRCDCKCPKEISTLEGRFGSAQYRRNSGNEDSDQVSDPMGGIESDKMSESAISQRLDRILGRSSSTTGTKDIGNQSVIGEAGVKTGRRFASLERRDPGYVPFVPLPADMFRKKPTEEQQPSVKEDLTSTKADQLTDTVLGEPGPGKSDESSYSEGFDNLTTGETNKESSDPSKGLSGRAAKIPNDNNLPTSVLDDDFPEIMPMRRGENRFVVSKKKDRSLTSPQYKRRIAMEQANNSNFVPFVPFPPGYFAKDKQPEDGSSKDESGSETCASSVAGNVQNTQKAEENKSEDSLGDSDNDRQIGSPRTIENRAGSTLAQYTNNLGNSRVSFNSRSSQDASAGVSSLNRQAGNPQNKTENVNPVFSGKSLEGSAVTEPDPLDMSEEAKAQRWFRRVAQINDISELSKIPDEDFPEIMPMRKGVNRFVVSKRKTPLERRLTSPQYRRNLPIVSSEPEKDSS